MAHAGARIIVKVSKSKSRRAQQNDFNASPDAEPDNRVLTEKQRIAKA